MRYLPALDGIRAFAVIIVVLFHARMPHMSGGFLGVDIFFVLSGFLITTLLITEHDRKSTIRIGRFYWRRAFRLTPPLAVLLIAYLVLAPSAWPEPASFIRAPNEGVEPRGCRYRPTSTSCGRWVAG